MTSGEWSEAREGLLWVVGVIGLFILHEFEDMLRNSVKTNKVIGS